MVQFNPAPSIIPGSVQNIGKGATKGAIRSARAACVLSGFIGCGILPCNKRGLFAATEARNFGARITNRV